MRQISRLDPFMMHDAPSSQSVSVDTVSLLRSLERSDRWDGIVGLNQKDLEQCPAITGWRGGFIDGRKPL